MPVITKEYERKCKLAFYSIRALIWFCRILGYLALCLINGAFIWTDAEQPVPFMIGNSFNVSSCLFTGFIWTTITVMGIAACVSLFFLGERIVTCIKKFYTDGKKIVEEKREKKTQKECKGENINV